MRTSVCYAATGFGLAVIAAALAAGRLPDAERRVLVLGNTAAIPEVAYAVRDVAGIGAVIGAFDAVYDYNDVVAPQHPSLWQPRDLDLPILERGLRALWSLDGDLHLVLANLHVEPAVNLALIFADAPIDVYADGLAGFGPTRGTPPRQVGVRVQRVLYPDLLAGVRPLLLRELGVEPVPIPAESLHQVLATIGAAAAPVGRTRPGRPVAVLVGQDLAAQSLLTADEEQRLHREMVEGAVAAGFRELVFKPRPSEPPGRTAPLVRRAEQLGAHLSVCERPELVETWYAGGSVGLVVGCFPTALITAAGYGVPAARVGTELLLGRLNPYETANRMAAVLVAATVPPLTGRSGSGRVSTRPADLSLEQLVATVGYLMQPSRNPDLRSTAAAVLEQRFPAVEPYVRAERLAQLDLPAGPGPARRT